MEARGWAAAGSPRAASDQTQKPKGWPRLEAKGRTAAGSPRAGRGRGREPKGGPMPEDGGLAKAGTLRAGRGREPEAGQRPGAGGRAEIGSPAQGRTLYETSRSCFPAKNRLPKTGTQHSEKKRMLKALLCPPPPVNALSILN